MATLKERLSGQLHEMVAERDALNEEIKQFRGFISSIDNNGAAPARRGSARRKSVGGRRRQRRAPVVSAEERRNQILAFMGKNKKQPVTSKQVAEHLGVTQNVARKHIEALVTAKGVKEAGVTPRPEGARGGRESKLYSLA